MKNSHKEQEKNTKGISFLLLGLYAFGGLGFEMLLAFIIEPLLYGESLMEFNNLENVLHWLITCFVWLIMVVFLTKISEKKYKFNIFQNKGDISKTNWIICILILLTSFSISFIDWNGFKVLKEFQYNGLLKFVFQYIYYVVETMLVALIIVFGQKAGELWVKNDKIPWGGLLTAITWGAIHILTKGDIKSGLLCGISSILFGIVYLLTKKNIKIAYLLILLMFVL